MLPNGVTYNAEKCPRSTRSITVSKTVCVCDYVKTMECVAASSKDQLDHREIFLPVQIVEEISQAQIS